MKCTPLVLAALLLWGCGDEDGSNTPPGGDGEGCNACSESEVCVIEYGDEKVERCEAIPEICDGIGSCENIDCQSAMYDYCPDETSAWGCSDTMVPTFISCTL